MSYVDLARAYVDASNDHDLGRIRPMLNAGCFYRSSGVGEHEGVPEIIAMMENFFEAYPDVSWRVDNFQQVGQRRISFDFSITLCGKTGQGRESIEFDENGLIQRIEVMR